MTMKRYLIILLFPVLSAYGQDTKPTSATLKPLKTWSLSWNEADSTVWLYKGIDYLWTQLQHRSDTLRQKGWVSNYKLSKYVAKKDTTALSGYFTNYKALDKQDKLTNPVTGWGSAGYIPKYVTDSTFNSSPIYVTNSRVLIGTTSDDTSNKLQVNGGIKASSIQLTTGATDGYYLKSDASGNGTWTAVSASQTYKGTWDASTNTPSLSNGTGTAGWYYRCVASGTVNFGAGNIAFSVGDDVSYNGSLWSRIPGAGYTLQIASGTILGGVKIGSGVSIDGSGVISVATNYLTDETDPNVYAWAKSATKPSYTYTEVGAASSTHNHSGVYEPVITKGTTSQYFRGDMSLATFPTIPTYTSQLTNNSNFLSSETDPNVYAWAKAAVKPTYNFSEVGAASASHNHSGVYEPVISKGTISQYFRGDMSLATFPTIPTQTSQLTNNSGFLTSESDPNVYAWAKASTKPSYTFSEIGSKPTTLSGYGITDTPWTNYLPLGGGTLSGSLSGTSASFSSTVTATNFILSSDKMLKENILSLSAPWVRDIRLVSYNFRNDKTKRVHYGVVAQEVEKVAPELVYTNDKGIKAVDYISLLVAKVAELEERIKQLENEKK